MALVFEVELQRMKWRLKRTWTRQFEGEGMKFLFSAKENVKNVVLTAAKMVDSLCDTGIYHVYHQTLHTFVFPMYFCLFCS